MGTVAFPQVLRTCRPSFNDGRHLFLMLAETKDDQRWYLSTYARSSTEAQQNVSMYLINDSKIIATCRVLRWRP